jgi:hypothetical protein
MIKYPALVSSGRRYSIGQIPVDIRRGFGGGDVRFLFGDDRFGLSMELQYEYLTDAEAKLIRDHYRDNQGTFVAFQLPPVIWSGQSAPGNIIRTDTLWQYATAPAEQHLSGGRFNVAVPLISVI